MRSADLRGRVLPAGTVLSGCHITRCEINACTIGDRRGGELSRVSDTDASDITVRGAYFFDVVFSQVRVDSARVLGPQAMFTGCYFDRVTLSKCQGPITISPRGYPSRVVDARADFYSSLRSFALDVSLSSEPLELRYVPPERVVVDPDRQAFVAPGKLPVDWKRLVEPMDLQGQVAGGVAMGEPWIFLTATTLAERSALRRLADAGAIHETFAVGSNDAGVT